MAQKKFTQLPAGTSPTGAEITAFVQGGSSARSTVLANTLSDSKTVDTSPGTFDFNFEFKQHRIFKCTPAFSGSKTINLSNFANALTFKFIFEIDGATILGFTAIGSGFRMDDVRWNLSPDLWIADSEEGMYLGEATYDGTDWFVKISGGNYVKT